MMLDPLEDLEATFHSYDIERLASVYSDTTGEHWLAKAWFNGREKGEKSVSIPKADAVRFINDEMTIDNLLSKYYPKQMSAVKKAIEQATNQYLGI